METFSSNCDFTLRWPTLIF